jgi:hypothetical protein
LVFVKAYSLLGLPVACHLKKSLKGLTLCYVELVLLGDENEAKMYAKRNT